ncbi:hypothetical protein [Actinoplanes sp. NPDC020271]|uniref:hypothetical protein n=1 Tax=Actinoplanes sp. NPDC020271 TaxID=3363896 RepID=UPI0037911B1D
MSRLIVVPIAAVLAVAGCTSTSGGSTAGSPVSPAAPAAATASAPAVAATTAAPARTSAEATPTAKPTEKKTTKATTVAPAPATAGGCPVSAGTLTAIPVPGYSAGEIKVVASSIQCADGWAQADPGIDGGDGVLVYHYSAGKWKFSTEGSSIDCGEVGIPKAAGKKLSVCYYQ